MLISMTCAVGGLCPPPLQKMQVKLHDKKITYFKSEMESEGAEAEKIYQCQFEYKKVELQICQADAVAFDKEKSALEVKLQIALAEVE